MRLVLVLLFVFGFYSSFGQKKVNIKDSIDRMLEGKRFDEVISFTEKNLKSDTINFHALLGMAFAKEGKEEYEEALTFYVKAKNYNPDSILGYDALGVFLNTMGLFREAEQIFSEMLEKCKTDSCLVNTYMNRASSKVGYRNFHSAYEDAYKSYMLDTTDTGKLNNIALIMGEINRTEEAAEIFKKLIKQEPDLIHPYVNLGLLYSKEGNYKEAIVYLDKAVSMDSLSPLPLNNRGLVRFYLGDTNGALEDINKSISIYPSNSYAYKNRAIVYIGMNRKEEACKDINTALEWGYTEQYGNEVLELQNKHCK